MELLSRLESNRDGRLDGLRGGSCPKSTGVGGTYSEPEIEAVLHSSASRTSDGGVFGKVAEDPVDDLVE